MWSAILYVMIQLSEKFLCLALLASDFTVIRTAEEERRLGERSTIL
jgi:hypothetical protein